MKEDEVVRRLGQPDRRVEDGTGVLLEYDLGYGSYLISITDGEVVETLVLNHEP
jgi:hypothetical protein